MIDKVPSNFKRIGIDYNPHTIEALTAIRDLVDLLPDEVSEEYYASLKGLEPDPITSWIRTAIAYGGKFGNVLARGGDRDYTQEAKRNAKSQSPKLRGVKLIHGSYNEHSYFENCLIYCDPPYQGTSSYKTGEFDHDIFWEWCRIMSKSNVVFISEYNAPDDFISVWSGEIKTNFASNRTKATHNATERLFVHSSQYTPPTQTPNLFT